jgi:hypothetical protein
MQCTLMQAGRAIATLARICDGSLHQNDKHHMQARTAQKAPTAQTPALRGTSCHPSGQDALHATQSRSTSPLQSQAGAHPKSSSQAAWQFQLNPQVSAGISRRGQQEDSKKAKAWSTELGFRWDVHLHTKTVQAENLQVAHAASP